MFSYCCFIILWVSLLNLLSGFCFVLFCLFGLRLKVLPFLFENFPLFSQIYVTGSNWMLSFDRPRSKQCPHDELWTLNVQQTGKMISVFSILLCGSFLLAHELHWVLRIYFMVICQRCELPVFFQTLCSTCKNLLLLLQPR